jgi:exopolyphosphatase/guanosine-5'-triphosphate,3'-diphosphate pyrophosphatase
VAHTYGIEALTFSDGALREGVLLDTIARLHAGDDGEPGELHHLREVSRASVRALAQRCDPDVAHSAHVAKLAVELFDQTQALHGLHHAQREYLEAGALLANVGLTIAHSKHHLHSYYVIRNSELAGLTDHEIEIVAQVARYHRKSSPKAAHDEFRRLSDDDQRVVRVLAGILRVAIGLDRSHDGRVTSVHARQDGPRLVVEAHTAGDADLELELYTAHERSDLLAAVTGLEVELRGVSEGARSRAAGP